MRTLQNEIWLDFADLLGSGVTEVTIKMGISRKSPKWQAIKDPQDGRKRLIRYATLGESYKESVRAELCGGLEPTEWLVMLKEQEKQQQELGKQAALVDRLFDVCDESYRRYMHYYRGEDTKTQRYLSRSAGIVVVLTEWYKVNNIPWKSYDPVKQAGGWIKQYKDKYFPKNCLPTNPIRLKETVLSYAVEGKELNEVVCLRRVGNENRAVHKVDLWWQQVAIKLRTDGKNWTQAQIFRKVRDVAPQLGKEAPSESTVRAFLASNEDITVSFHTDLNNKKRQRHRTIIPLAPAMHSHECWEMDGTKVQFAGHLTGKKTKDGRAETKSLSIVSVRDVYSGAWIGFWYGYGEDENAYRCALKMAVDVTGYLPYELRYDQFPGSNSAGWKYLAGDGENEGALEIAGVKLTKTSKAEGKAHLERAYLTLQQVFESEKEQFIGLGIKAGIAHARPTELYISRMQRQYLNAGWDFDQAWMAHAEVISAYNHTLLSDYSRKHKALQQSPWQMLENGVSGTKGRPISAEDIAILFWEARREGVRNDRIAFTYRKKEHLYYVTAKDYDLLDYQRKNKKVVVRFDPADMSSVMVFDEAGECLAYLKEQALIPTFGPNADYAALAEFKQEQAKIKDIRKKKLAEYALSDEVAAILPTTTGKKVHNDALETYAMNNAGKWSAKPDTGRRMQEFVTVEDLDLDKFTRDSY